MKRLMACGFFLLVASFDSHADPGDKLTLEPLKKQVFKNTDCKKTNTCDLKEFYLESYGYRVDFKAGGHSRGTGMRASYTTDKKSNLQKYGIAQFIKGCQFGAIKENGKVKKMLNIVRPYYGKMPTYLHVDWQNDGLISDPIDWGNDPTPVTRHDYYRWNSKPGSFDKNTEKYFFRSEPGNPRLYVQDHPGAVSTPIKIPMTNNISVQFRTCIYKAAEVPTSVPCGKLDFAKPLKCFEWNSSFIYNFDTGKFDSPKELDPICQALPEEIEEGAPPACYELPPPPNPDELIPNLVNQLNGGAK